MQKITAIEALQTFITIILQNLTLTMDFDKAYGAQCVDLIRYWLSFLALPQISSQPLGGAADLMRNCPANMKIIDVKSALPGDIFVMPRSKQLPWGHTGIVTSILQNNGKVNTIEANWDGKARNPPLRLDKTVSKFSGLIRPSQFSIPDFTQKNQFGQYVTWRVKKLANVRAQAISTSAITGSRLLLPGNTFKGLNQTVTGQKVDTNDQWVKSAKGNFVWAGNLERA